MNPIFAQDWLNSMLEVAIGMYVFFVGLPSLMYSNSINQELKELSGISLNAWRNIIQMPTLIILFIVLLSFFHLFCTKIPTNKWIPRFFNSLNWFDGMPIDHLTCNNEFDKDGECSFFSALIVFSVAFLFVVFLISSFKFSTTKEKSLKNIANNLSIKIITNCKPGNKYSEAKELESWRMLEALGNYTNPGQQRKIWLNCLEIVILNLADLGEGRINIERLRIGLRILNDVIGDPSLAPFENVKDALNIYRALLNKLKGQNNEKSTGRLIECYSIISKALYNYASASIKNENPAILPTIISTLKLIPDSSSNLFEIAVVALQNGKYQTLAHSFNDIIGHVSQDESRQHNFWGIYAALYLKDGAFQQHAEQMRKNSGFPTLNNRDLRAAYHYHFSNAHFDVADCLYKLMENRSKKDPVESG